ncbi:MAG: hypothetical protein EXR79_01135 [Myxococcales bacterium]|nr:hypothetical protein [Myxococcales bacterium]
MVEPGAIVHSLHARLLARAHVRVLVAAVGYGQKQFDRALVHRAATAFLGVEVVDRADLEAVLDEREAHAQFLPWLLWDAPRGPRKPPLAADLRDRFRTGVERTVLDGLLTVRPDAYCVACVDAAGVVLERLADGSRTHLSEPTLRAVAAVGEIYIARILHVGDIALLDAVHACMPAAARPQLEKAAVRAARGSRSKALPTLIAACQQVAQRLARLQPGLAEVRGQMHATLVFALTPGADVTARLDGLAASGELERLRGRLSIRHPAIGPVGTVLRLSDGRLLASTSAPWRARSLRIAVERAVPGVRYVCTLFRDLGPLFDLGRREELPRHELRRLAEDWLGECLLTFSDTPHVWLDGATPREAVRTASGRTQVQAWLRDVERVGEVAGPACRAAVDSLRQELALA